METIDTNKKILITGGTGFLGEALIKRLYPQPIRVVARNEGKLIELKEKYPKIEIITGDIADEWVAKKAMKGIKYVYHLAAFKHVGMAETNSFECINSNITGSLNILAESLNERPALIIGISTDKAAKVSGVYGATKLCMEALFREAESMNPETQYRIVRYGNVLYSTGSVLCKWIERIKQGKPVMITNPDSTRFYWTKEQAVDHIFQCITNATDSTPYIPAKMKAIRLGDLLEATLQKYGRVNVEVKELGNAENMHETMDGKTFSCDVELLPIKEIIKLI